MPAAVQPLSVLLVWQLTCWCCICYYPASGDWCASNGSLDGLDSLLSTVQMPGGIPVATVAIGSAGAKNAAYLAAQIIGVADPAMHEKLLKERADNAAAVIAKDAAMHDNLHKG